MSIDEDIPLAATPTDLEICQAVCEQYQAMKVNDSDGEECVEENPPTNAKIRQALDILKRGVQYHSTNFKEQFERKLRKIQRGHESNDKNSHQSISFRIQLGYENTQKKSDPSTCRPCLSSLSWSPWWFAPWPSGPTITATTTTVMPLPPTSAAITETLPSTTGGRSEHLLLRILEKYGPNLAFDAINSMEEIDQIQNLLTVSDLSSQMYLLRIFKNINNK
ncbi:hypothetical protein AVEN_135018-1 [Araneus ventricosus]|uniref:Uncharacterized protein n=1 Tax=Araneus ventricosus TaxID=182803 RepID=A0A4Y2G7S0_ARAVE|nr:hypothetical protein AVEN_135018-1 [Araneus ventricosus]